MKSGHSLTEPLPASGERFQYANATEAYKQIRDSTASLLNGQSSPAKSQRVTTEPAAAPPSSKNSPFHGIESKKLQNLSKDRPNSRTSSPAATVLPHPDLTIDMIDPMRKVVVEHIVRTNDTAALQPISFHLRSFSGKVPRPANEPDFDTQWASVQLLLDDPSNSDLSRTRRILDSLLSPAADVIKHMSPQSSPSVYLEVLESVYGSVEDGDKLFAKFMTMLQNPGDRLRIMLSTTVRRDCISESEQNHCLVREFCHGCWDNGLIASLQLEKKKKQPTFLCIVGSIHLHRGRSANLKRRQNEKSFWTE